MNAKSAVVVVVIVLIAGFSQAQELFLFGGYGNKTFLGSFTASKYAQSSIWNAYGDYGSKYSAESIWNKYGDYGSNYSDFSPWNPYANNPPVVVDGDGNFYGYFTTNKYKRNRTRIKELLRLLGEM